MGDVPIPPVSPMPSAMPIPQTDTALIVSNVSGETWSQWARSDKFLLLLVYVFLVFALFHAAHDASDKDLVAFMENGATGAFSGLMVALRGKQEPK